MTDQNEPDAGDQPGRSHAVVDTAAGHRAGDDADRTAGGAAPDHARPDAVGRRRPGTRFAGPPPSRS